jgi:hypothetical protein
MRFKMQSATVGQSFGIPPIHEARLGKIGASRNAERGPGWLVEAVCNIGPAR